MLTQEFVGSSSLTRWMEAFHFNVELQIHSREWNHSIVLSNIHSFIHSLFIHSIIHYPFIHSLFHSIINWSIHLVINSCTRSFIASIARSSFLPPSHLTLFRFETKITLSISLDGCRDNREQAQNTVCGHLMVSRLKFEPIIFLRHVS